MTRPLSLARTAAALSIGSLCCLPLAAPAQGVDQTLNRIDQLQQLAPARQRAINLARNTVVKLNGGLSR